MPKNRFILKDVAHENKLFTNRLIIAWLLMVVAFSIVVSRLFFLQVTNYSEYTTLSEKNHLKILPIPPTRGLIYDRNGVLLAGNHTSYGLEVVPEQVDNHIDTLFKQLGGIIAITEADIEQFKQQRRQRRKFEPVPLRFHLTEDEVARFSAQRHRFEGVEIVSNLSRYYPLGTTAAHIIGYVGRINEKELEVIDPTNYRGTDYIGKMGIEKYYEKQLYGIVGYQKVEANARGRIVRTLERNSSVAGQNLYLNIDIELQTFVEDLFKEKQGAVVAIDPNTGAVLTLVSMPGYDPNLFANGIDSKTYQQFLDSPSRPLLNRAVRGLYPPGSTVKPFVGLAGLEYGVRNVNSNTWCRGWYSLKGQSHMYRDWKKKGHGVVNLHTAIEQSCDVYFYSLAHDLGIDRLHAFMSRFSFGKKTGIDVYSESGGLMPSQRWKQEVRKRPWYAGDTLIVGIGQGSMLATPLQLAVATAALSMRGQLRQPRAVFAIDGSGSDELGETVLAPKQSPIVLKRAEFWDAAIRGMEAVVHGNRGTARKVGLRSPYRLAGKTGTAQVVSIKQGEQYNARKLAKKFHDHALFIAFAPLGKPQIAVAVIVENGGSGSGAAAPLAKKVMDYYLLPDSRLRLAESQQKKVKN
ncbi:MAG: penicillin-binding protein 2 [Beggiatoa sp. IS2]|nr:MAG: penicillin-binding protein 2 [Beggiatoa sp. IS2]